MKNVIKIHTSRGCSNDWVKVKGLTKKDQKRLNKIGLDSASSFEDYLSSLNNDYLYKVLSLLDYTIHDYFEYTYAVIVVKKDKKRDLKLIENALKGLGMVDTDHS